jgi:hypothetical protein
MKRKRDWFAAPYVVAYAMMFQALMAVAVAFIQKLL